MKDIQIIDNFLSEKELQEALDIIEKTKWVYGNHSGKDGEIPTGGIFWYGLIDENSLFYEVILNKIRNIFKKNFKLLSIHVNGQTYAQDGDFHVDYSKDNAYTCLIYLSDITHKNIDDIGGYTLIKTKNGTVCIEPFLNRLLLFKSNLMHRGLAPSRYSDTLRVSIAFRFLEVA